MNKKLEEKQEYFYNTFTNIINVAVSITTIYFAVDAMQFTSSFLLNVYMTFSERTVLTNKLNITKEAILFLFADLITAIAKLYLFYLSFIFYKNHYSKVQHYNIE